MCTCMWLVLSHGFVTPAPWLLRHRQSARASAPALVLIVGEEIGAGNYGFVHAATLDGQPVVAKRANGDELAESYLDVEAAVNAELSGADGFCSYLGEQQAEDKVRWLVWERISGGADGDEKATTLADIIANAAPSQSAAAALEAATGLTLAECLRALLRCLQRLRCGRSQSPASARPGRAAVPPARLPWLHLSCAPLLSHRQARAGLRAPRPQAGECAHRRRPPTEGASQLVEGALRLVFRAAPLCPPVLQGLRPLQLVPERSLSILDADPAAGARLRPPQR